MKINIQRIDYKGRINTNGKFYRWDEKCDVCGADCKTSVYMSNVPPDPKEKDYCIKCIRAMADNLGSNTEE